MKTLAAVLFLSLTIATAYSQSTTGTIEVQCQNPSGNGLRGEGTFRFYGPSGYLGMVPFDCSGSEIFEVVVDLDGVPDRIYMTNRLYYTVNGDEVRVNCPGSHIQVEGHIAKARSECWAGDYPSLPFMGDCTRFTWVEDQ